MRATPTTVPIKTRMAGVIRLFSNEYFTRKTIPRKRTKPPIQANNFTPKRASQSKGLEGTAGGRGMGGGAASGGRSGGGGGGGTAVWITTSGGAACADRGIGGCGAVAGAGFGSAADGAGSA